MVFLSEDLWFPDPSEAEEDGLLAVGGDLSPERLMLAYRSGIFPWFIEYGEPYWFAPAERMVLFCDDVHIGRTLKKLLSSGKFQVTYDTAFNEVIRSCAAIHQKKDGATWISDEFVSAYERLHNLGFAHSVEVWHKDQLAGGIYGVTIGKIFCGESMFSVVSNASKIGLINLCRSGKYSLIDCQVASVHLAALGGKIIGRNSFLKLLHAQKFPG
jgi:leucyl/phenylalanyl-tRNA--protein transferase